MSANTVNVRPTVPTDVLETTASAQRLRIHESISELRAQVQQALDVRRQVRSHLVPASATIAAVSLILGYGLGGMFRPTSPRHRW
jgi:hypothetical protein